ncbi:MAG: hypothetical protein F6K42_07115 [Leptolyngbya sp. SIO1D8]|nr:hypothetical protein [Leptolyngbya sp. SIO1D8]
MMSTRKTKIFFPVLILTVGILFFMFSAAYLVDLPGLYYDEVLFVNAALGGINNDFIFKEVFDFPIMLMPYIGALKAYIYYPIFHVFGVSPESIRLPSIFISVLTLLIAFYLGKLFFRNQYLAALLVVLMATDPAFIYSTRLDWGPVTLMNLLKISSLFFLFKILREGTSKNISLSTWMFALCLLLGLFDKLNFIWFITAICLSTIIFYPVRIRDIFHLYKFQIAKPFLAFLIAFSGIVIFLVLPILGLGVNQTAAAQPFGERLQSIFNIYKITTDGQSIYGFIFAEDLSRVSHINSISLIIFLTTAIALFWRLKQEMDRRRSPKGAEDNNKPISMTESPVVLYGFLLILFSLIFLQILFTKQAGGPHHIMMLFPLAHFINIASVPIILKSFSRQKSLLTTNLIILVLAFGCLLYSQLAVVQEYSQTFRKGDQFSNLWSPTIYQLSDYLNLQTASTDQVVSIDWGVHNQLFSLAAPGKHDMFIDLWPTFKEFDTMTDSDVEDLFNSTFKGKRTLAIAHSPQAEIMTGSRDNFLQFANRFFPDATLQNQFFEQDNVLFEVYFVNEEQN